MIKSLFYFTALLILVVSTGTTTHAQQYKLRQVSNMMNMKTESTIFVKGMRKRTETGGMMGMPAPPVTIEQCDLQRTIKLNDKKKLYFIEPFSKETEEVIEEGEKPVPVEKIKPVVPVQKEKTSPKSGGIISMYYNITDTGERKKMSGFIARHVWTSQKIKPSSDACSMKDSIIIKTDGWYIDLPQFNCPVHYRPAKSMMNPSPGEKQQPDCQDKFVTHRSGKGKLGFPLTETRTMIMGSGNGQVNEFTSSLETLEFSTLKLDSMLFEIPPGYTEVTSEDQLREKLNVNDMINQYKNMNKEKADNIITGDEQKRAGAIRIGVYAPTGSDEVQTADLQVHMVSTLMTGNIEAVSVASAEEAKKLNCDYTLASDFTKLKQASKVGGLLKAIKNADLSGPPFNIDVTQTLVKLADGSVRLTPKMSGKYEGKIDAAAEKALDEGCFKVLNELNK